MLGNLTPWKKKQDGNVKVRREDEHPVARLRQEVDELFDRFWDDWRTGTLSTWDESQALGSRVSFDDKEKEYVVQAELPGFEPKDIDVKVSGNVLTMRAEHNEEGKDGNDSYRRYGSFYESFTLPQGVLSDQIDARYHSGVLEVHLPKSEESRAKRIAVKSA